MGCTVAEPPSAHRAGRRAAVEHRARRSVRGLGAREGPSPFVLGAFGNLQGGELARKTTRISPPSMVVSLEEVSMHTITITLSDDRLAKLQEIAARLHIAPEELARAGVEDLLPVLKKRANAPLTTSSRKTRNSIGGWRSAVPHPQRSP